LTHHTAIQTNIHSKKGDRSPSLRGQRVEGLQFQRRKRTLGGEGVFRSKCGQWKKRKVKLRTTWKDGKKQTDRKKRPKSVHRASAKTEWGKKAYTNAGDVMCSLSGSQRERGRPRSISERLCSTRRSTAFARQPVGHSLKRGIRRLQKKAVQRNNTNCDNEAEKLKKKSRRSRKETCYKRKPREIEKRES